MSTIFNTSYTNNANRLNSSVTNDGKDKSGATEKGSEFKRVLGDLERPPVIVNNATILAEARQRMPKQPEPLPSTAPVLTNVPSEEINGLTASPIQLVPLPKTTDVSAADPLYRTVKFNPEPVKFLAPETVSTPITQANTPPSPVVTQVTRTDPAPATGKPQTPQLARVERRDVTPSYGEQVIHPKHAIKEIIRTAGKFYGVDPNLGMAVAQAESSFQPTAVSKDGHESKGIFQLLDNTGHDMLSRNGIDKEHYDPFDPAQNAYLGVGYLRRLHDIFSEQTELGGNLKTFPVSSAEHLEKLAVAAFNTGEGNVARAQARAQSAGKDPADFASVEPYLPASTRQYVQRVSQLRDLFAAAGQKSRTA